MPTRISYVEDSQEPVTVDEAKLAARVDGTDLDPYIEGVIASARASAEHITGRCYREQVLREELQYWPAAGDAIAVYQATACEVRYWNGVDFVLLAANAYVFAAGGVGSNGTVLAPVAGTSWPTLSDRPVGARVRIDLTAGPDSPADVPAQIKLYIKAQVAAWVDNPQALSSKQVELSPLLDRLLDEHRLWS